MVVGGIDPGLDGACAIVDNGKLIYCAEFLSVEAKTRGRDLVMSQVWLTVASAALHGPEIVYVERVQAMPKQGASSGFKLGVCYGAALMACAGNGLAMQTTEPRMWMQLYHLHGRDNDGAIREACKMFPDKVEWFTPVRGRLTKATCTGRADAALIALWGYRYSTR